MDPPRRVVDPMLGPSVAKIYHLCRLQWSYTAHVSCNPYLGIDMIDLFSVILMRVTNHS